MPKIPAKTTIRLLDRMAFMNSQFGEAFNGMITLNFEQIGASTELEANRALTKLNEAVADRINRHGQVYSPDTKLPHLYMFVHEHVESYGHHVHELIVLPRGLGANFNEWLQAWARRNFGPSIDPRAILYKGRHCKGDDARAAQQWRLATYILKSSADACIPVGGGATTLHLLLEVEKRKRAYCANVARVAGTSQNIATLALISSCFRLAAFEEMKTDAFLQEYHRRIRSEELTRQLRSVDI